MKTTQLTRIFVVKLMLLPLVACQQATDPVANKAVKTTQAQTDKIWPKLIIAVKPDRRVEAQVAQLLAKMTLAQKVAQMIQPEIRDVSVADMRKYGFGSYLNGGGSFPENNKYATPADWITLAENMYQASIDDSLDGSSIPTMWGTDAVHGHNNVIGATLFPHNIGLGAANNAQLIENIAAITAKEVMVTGIDWVFAPTVAVVRDDRWGRTYEGYSEDPEIVHDYAAAIVKGLQGAADKDFLGDERVISTIKHFIGDGGTEGGDDQGNNIDHEQALFDIHAQGYVGGLTAGAQSVMASFNSWQGNKLHGNKYLLTDVLKTRMGFDGFVVGDWSGHGQIKGCSNESCPQAINAGLDIYMVPTKAWKPLYENTIKQVENGEIAQSRIDDAVTRILRVKVRAGLFNKPSPAKRRLSGKTAFIGAKTHRDIAQQAVRESLVLLKNQNNALPLKQGQHILITGEGADNIGKQSGGWSVTWQGTGNSNDDFPGGTSIFAGFKAKFSGANRGGSLQLSKDGSYQQKPDVAVVVFGEDPYAEGNGDLDDLEYQRGDKKDLALLKSLKAQGITVVSVFISGRPLWVNAELNASDAFVAAWLPGSEGAGIADVLLTNKDGSLAYDFVGKLSYSWPASAEQTAVNRHDENYQPLLPYGYGLSYGSSEKARAKLSYELNEETIKRTSELLALKIFDRSVKKPWRVTLNSADKSQKVTSNVQTFGALTMKTLDKVVQEDARSLTFDGSAAAAYTILANFPEDLRAYPEVNSVLSFSVKLDQKPSDKVTVAMLCGNDCNAGLDITAQLSAFPMDQWQTLTIDLACFAKAGLNFSTVISPYQIASKGKVALSIADVAFIPQQAEQASLSCQ